MYLHHIEGIRFGEFDIGRVLYHANYFHLYEAAREAFLISEGYPYSRLMQDHSHFAVVESHQDFLKPIVYGEKLLLELRTADVKRSSFRFEYELRKESGEVCHRA